MKLAEQNDYTTLLMMHGDLVYWCTLAEGVFACNMDTREIHQVIKWSLPREREGAYYQYSIAADHQYIYMARLGIMGEPTGEEGLTIYDLEGNEIQYISYDGRKQPLQYLLATPDTVIFGVADEGHEPQPVCYLERMEIAEGKAEFLDIKQP